MKDLENMGLTNRELNEEKERIYENYKRDMEGMSLAYHDVKLESQKEMDDIRKNYDSQINELKEQLRNKNNEIQDLYKANFSKDAHISGLQTELNTAKDKYYKLEKKLNTETERLNDLLQQ